MLTLNYMFTVSTAVHLIVFLSHLPFAKHTVPPRTDILITIIVVAIVLSAVLAGVAVGTCRATAVRRTVSGWSPLFVLLWSFVFGYLLLVNYPLPPHVHHLDKFLFVCGLLVLWGLMVLFAPARVKAVFDSRFYGAAALLLVNMLVFVVVGEGVFRAVDPYLARAGLFGDKQTPATMKPGVPVRGTILVTNSQGFRDRERAFVRRDNAPRVLALGDSMTWGAGVSYDETFATLLEQSLNALTAGAEVINLGVPGWGPHEELHLLKVYGVDFHPDVILLNFFIGNDIQNDRWDDLNLSRILVVGGRSCYLHSNGNFVHDVFGLDRLYLYHDLNYLFTVGLGRMRHAAEHRDSQIPAGEWAPLTSREQYVKSIHERDNIYLRRNSPLFDAQWARTAATLLQIKSLADRYGLPLMIVAIPDHVQVDPSIQDRFLAGIEASPDQYDFEKPQRLLRAWSAKHGVPMIDLLPVFRSNPRPDRLYFQNDYHLTAAGHSLTAAALLPSLRVALAIP